MADHPGSDGSSMPGAAVEAGAAVGGGAAAGSGVGRTLDEVEVVGVAPGRALSFRLVWQGRDEDDPLDLDLGCFYWTTDGDRGAVQPVSGPRVDGSRRGRGRRARPGDGSSTGRRRATARPLVTLSADEVDGGTGERLTIHRPRAMRFLVVHASIYRGAPDFRGTGAMVTAASGGETIAEVALRSPAPGMEWCAVLVLGRTGRDVVMIREERYFRSAYHADRHYGLGLDWVMGHKAEPAAGDDGGDGPGERPRSGRADR